MFKFNNVDTRTTPLTSYCVFIINFDAFIVNFEHILLSLSLTLLSLSLTLMPLSLTLNLFFLLFLLLNRIYFLHSQKRSGIVFWAKQHSTLSICIQHNTKSEIWNKLFSKWSFHPYFAKVFGQSGFPAKSRNVYYWRLRFSNK